MNTISGSVVTAAGRCGVSVPSHEFVVNMVHAMEMKKISCNNRQPGTTLDNKSRPGLFRPSTKEPETLP